MADEEIETKTYSGKLPYCRPYICLPILWGSTSGLVLAIVGVYDLFKADDHVVTGIFLLSVGLVVLCLEIFSLLSLTFLRKVHCCLKYISLIGWLETWKRGLVYTLVGIFCFLAVLRTKYSIVCGISMVLAGSLYILKTCRARRLKASTKTDRRILTEDFQEEQNLDV
ncbi:hypothetical protein HOLleu_08381 [Holothuria leucospilota]|uniref:Uncharacterized protein n=1 Tax=Holothuria leucospilota TaxID=206669 RepID=A0A9Q1CI57_HOLLE|nr:hypothetical protein HOLleu_08381 [Holothuria leucospilota]